MSVEINKLTHCLPYARFSKELLNVFRGECDLFAHSTSFSQLGENNYTAWREPVCKQDKNRK